MTQTTSTDDGSILRALLLVVLLLIAIPFVLMVVMTPMMNAWGVGHMNGWMWDGSGATWAWILIWLVMLLIIIGGGYLVFRSITNAGGTRTDPALEALRMSYARGELSEEEFEERRARLEF